MVDIHLQGQKVENATTSDIQELVKMGVLPTPYRNGEPEALKLAQMIFQHMQQQELLRMQQHQQQHQPAQITGGYVGQPLLPQANPAPYEVPRNVIPRPLEVNPTVVPIPVHSVTAPPTSPPVPPPTWVGASAPTIAAAPPTPPRGGGFGTPPSPNPGKPQAAAVKGLARGRKGIGVALVFLLAFFVPIGVVWWKLKGGAPAKEKVESPTPAASPSPAPPAANPAPAPAAQEPAPAPPPPPPPVDAPTERLRQQIIIDKPIQP